MSEPEKKFRIEFLAQYRDSEDAVLSYLKTLGGNLTPHPQDDGSDMYFLGYNGMLAVSVTEIELVQKCTKLGTATLIHYEGRHGEPPNPAFRVGQVVWFERQGNYRIYNHNIKERGAATTIGNIPPEWLEIITEEECEMVFDE